MNEIFQTLEIARPDDWHLHLRDGQMLKAVLPQSSEHFARAIIMPNLVPPVVTFIQAKEYYSRIMDALEQGSSFTPLMTLYLTEETEPQDVKLAAESGLVKAVKLYPAGATTNSQSGVTNFANVMNVLETMADIGLPLCVHGEVTDPQIDIFDREAVFIETVLAPMRESIPQLQVVMEHVTTEDGVEYVKSASGKIGATITTHHLIINRNDILAGGIRPHNYCLPVAKRERHRLALVEAATSGNERFFLGTDSAPHLDAAKLSECGCAGIFTAPNTMSCLAHVFEAQERLENLESFSSLNGPKFYGLGVNDEKLVLEKCKDAVVYPPSIQTPEGPVTIFNPGFELYWRAQVK